MKWFRVIASSFWAVAALLVGHEVAYRLAFTDAKAREHALEHSGHGWLGLLVPVAVMAFAAGLVASVLVGRSGSTLRRHAFTTHALAQVGAYLVIEAGERLLTGHSVSSVLTEMTSISGLRLLAVGVLAQVLCAFLVSLLSQGAEAIGGLFATRAPHPQGSARLWLPVRHGIASQGPINVIWSRGPPAVAATTSVSY